MDYKKFQSYRHFATFGECRAWVKANIIMDAILPSVIVEGEIRAEARVVVSLEPSDAPARWRTYRMMEYTWRGFNEDYDEALAFAVLEGRAVKSLARIVWRADSAQASWHLRLMESMTEGTDV